MNFALLACPYFPEQILSGRPMLRWLPKGWWPALSRFFRVKVEGQVQVSNLEGILLNFPLLPSQTKHAGRKAAQAAKTILDAGVRVVGLESGLRSLAPVFAENGLAVSRGYALQVASALTVLLNCITSGMEDPHLVIINAGTPPGGVCARVLAPMVRHLTLMGSFHSPLQRLASRILRETGTAPVLTGLNRHYLERADLVIDLAQTEFANDYYKTNAIVWQPWKAQDYCGSTQFIGEALLGLDNTYQFEGDLPVGIIRSSTAEAILQGMGKEIFWPRNTTEITADQTLRIFRLARQAGMRIVGSIYGKQVSIFPKQVGFDK